MQNKHGFAAVAIIVIVVALAVVGGLAYALINRNSSTQPVTENTVTIPETTTTTAPLPTQTSSTAGNFNAETNQESFKDQPGAIVSVSKTGDGWMLSVNFLTRNPSWIPGDTEPFFLDSNPQVRELSVASATKAYWCGPEGQGRVPTTPANLLEEIHADNGRATAYFDTTGSFVTAFYEQCLP